MRRLAVANEPNIFQTLLVVLLSITSINMFYIASKAAKWRKQKTEILYPGTWKMFRRATDAITYQAYLKMCSFKLAVIVNFSRFNSLLISETQARP